jgi:hypothetical protein
MVTPPDRPPRWASLAICTAMAAAMLLVAYGTTGDTVRIWKIGSPYRGNTPDTVVPFALNEESIRRGQGISIEAFPAKGFAATFREAVTRNEPPDILVFDNFGVMEGITTDLGTFEGIGEEPTRPISSSASRVHLTSCSDPSAAGRIYLRCLGTMKLPGGSH